MGLITLRFAAFSALLAVAGCGSVPLSNPADVTPAADPALPLLSDLDVAADAPNVTLAAPAPSPRQGGLLSRLLGGGQSSVPSGVDAALAEAVADPDAETVAETAPAAPRRGLFGLLNASAGSSGPAPRAENEIPPGTMMAFGEIGPTCGMSRRDLGTEIAKASGYTIYDTFPNSTAPRPHYITGFSDGCARQFTAALVLLGDVGTHEVVRYNRTRVDLPYSKTDSAYEAIKSSFCRSGFGKPCGARLERLATRTTFVTAYERFGAGPIWAEFLLHDGTVAASALEGE